MKTKLPSALLLLLLGGAAFGSGCGQIEIGTGAIGGASTSSDAGAGAVGGEAGGAAGMVASSGAASTDGGGVGGAAGEAAAGVSGQDAAKSCTPPGPAAWAGCYAGQPCSVCADMIAAFPLYLRRYPHCESFYACDHNVHSGCSTDCPPPGDADQCDGTLGNWEGCRGLGCYVCTELVADYPRYFVNHPFCVSNATCNNSYSLCSAACPPPGPADR